MSITHRLVAASIFFFLILATLGMLSYQGQQRSLDILTGLDGEQQALLRELAGARDEAASLSAYFEALHRHSEIAPVPEEERSRLVGAVNSILAPVRTLGELDEFAAARKAVANLRYSLGRLGAANGVVSVRMAAAEFSRAQIALEEAVATLEAADEAERREGVDEVTFTQTLVIAAAGLSLLGLCIIGLVFHATSIRPVKRGIAALEDVAAGSREREVGSSGPSEARRLVAALADVVAAIERQKREHLDEVDAARKSADLERRLLGNALDNIDAAVCVLNGAGKLVFSNAAFASFFGAPPEEATANMLFDSPAIYARIGENEEATLVHQAQDGRVIEVTRRGLAGNALVMCFSDITEKRHVEERLSHLVDHDALTNLTNRAAFLRRLAEVLAEGRRGIIMGVLHMRGMKALNDTQGHHVGDALLRSVADRLVEVCGSEAEISRLGSDEFAFICGNGRRGLTPETVADRVLAIFKSPFEIADQRVPARGTLGLNVLEPGQKGERAYAEGVLRNCELAVQAAKRSDEVDWRLFDPALREEQSRRRELERDLRVAIEEQTLHLVFQPLVDVSEKQVSGFEALLRWNHPERGPISPANFVPIAEDSGLIVPLGRWILRKACETAVGWPDRYRIAVNLSPVQFRQPDLLDDVRAALTESGLNPERLEIEVTESLFIGEDEAVPSKLRELRELGVSISMDDFGTGYSSLGYISRFPFDKIKIDQSFVRDMGRSENMAIVRSVIGLSKALGMRVVAEGIETIEQMRILEQEGCNEMQGYLFARPTNVEDLAATTLRIRRHWDEEFALAA